METKLHAPRTPRRLVRRRRLLEMLTRESAPLLVFSAPAGCGKTLAVLQWLEDDGRPWAWLQLDEGDNDPVTLLQYLVRALASLSPLDPAVRTWLELPDAPVRKVILPALIKAVSAAPPFVLVLDDAHALHDGGCWRLLEALLGGLSPGSSLVVCGRVEPPLPLSRLRPQDQVAEYTYGDLAFDIDETRRLLALHDVVVDDTLLADLAQATEGWPAAIYLAVLSWRSRKGGRPSLPAVDRRQVAAYLNAEVLSALSPDVVEFLMRTSVVERVCPGLAAELTGSRDSARILETIHRENAFLIPLDDSGDQFRYHHLFRDLLQLELRRREPESLPDLHRRAAGWFEREGQPSDALRHLLAADDIDAAAELVTRGWWPCYLAGRVGTARRWVEMFSSGQLEDHPTLRVAAAWILAFTGDGESARSLLAGLEPSRLDAAPVLDRALSPRSSFAVISALLAADGPLQMREDARQAVRLEGHSPGPWPSLCHFVLGVAEMLCGDDEAAVGPLKLAAKQAEGQRNGVDLAALGELSLIAGDAASWEEATRYTLEAARRAGAYKLGYYLPTSVARLARDRLAGRDGDDDALADMEEVAQQSSEDFCPWVGVRGRLLLAEARIWRDEVVEARRRLDDARRILGRWAQAPGLVRRLEILEHRLQARSAIEPLSPAELRVLGFMPTNLTVAEIADRLGVSPNTVGSHVKALHRKLGAKRRSDVVERALALGLLPSSDGAARSL